MDSDALTPRPGTLAATFTTDPHAPARVAVVGLPDDTGVALNGGRVGARLGPAAVRAALARYGTAAPHAIHFPTVFDAGDIAPSADLDDTHARIEQRAAELLANGMIVVGIGGGHDLTLPLVRALLTQGSAVSGVYLDAHLDVRPEPGSGMTFHRLLAAKAIDELHVHGLDPFANSHEHRRWFGTHDGTVFTDDEPPAFPISGDLFLSLDIDVIDQAYAPGVSAMNPNGWAPARAAAWANAAGREPRVRLFDIMELNPAHDVGGRTARLAAHLLLHFLAGVGARPA